MDERDDTDLVQGFLDRGERIPPGEYRLRGPLTVPAAYPFKVVDAGIGLIGAAKNRATITGGSYEEFARRWAAAKHGPPRILTPLPRRVRLRLAVTHAVNAAGIWLVDHGHIGAAERMWRLTSHLL